MPDFTTHYIFGQKVLEKLDKSISNDLHNEIYAFNWGLQGPDLLFFRKALTGNSRLPSYGDYLHSEKTTELFNELFRYLKSQIGSTDYPHIKAYIFGFLCHYILDITIHPYVFFHEYRKHQLNPQKSHKIIHSEIESCLDSDLYFLFFNKPVTDFNIGEVYKIQSKVAASVSNIYVEILYTLYGIKVPESEISCCFTDTLRLSRLLYDKTGFITCTIAKIVEFMLGKPEAFSCHIKRKTGKTNYMNFTHAEWYNLWHPEIKLNSSIPELFETALVSAVNVVGIFEKAILSDQQLPVSLEVPFDNGSPRNR